MKNCQKQELILHYKGLKYPSMAGAFRWCCHSGYKKDFEGCIFRAKKNIANLLDASPASQPKTAGGLLGGGHSYATAVSPRVDTKTSTIFASVPPMWKGAGARDAPE